MASDDFQRVARGMSSMVTAVQDGLRSVIERLSSIDWDVFGQAMSDASFQLL